MPPYQGLKARRAGLQATLDRIDAGGAPTAEDQAGANTHATTAEVRADIQRKIEELDRLIRLPGHRA